MCCNEKRDRNEKNKLILVAFDWHFFNRDAGAVGPRSGQPVSQGDSLLLGVKMQLGKIKFK